MNQTESDVKELELLKKNIVENFPDFQVKTVKKLGEGWMSKAVLVNKEWVFRFPKKEEGSHDLEKEIKILPHLSKYISFNIPDFEYNGKQSTKLLFVGYKCLPGETLDEDNFSSFSEMQQKKMARQIAKFIDELSSFPVKKAKKLGVPENDFYKDFKKVFKKTKKEIFPLINKEKQKYVSSRFEKYLNTPEYFDYKPTLIHADLSPNHYLIDPESEKITGIIDFGDLHIGDPDFEYTYILEDCGEYFTRKVMEYRKQKKIKKRLEKVSIFVTFTHIASIFEGLKRNESELINDGLKAIQEEMRSMNL